MDDKIAGVTKINANNNSMWRLFPSWLGDSAVVIALGTGLLYAIGYAQHESLFLALQLPVRSIELPINVVALYGVSYWGAVLMVLALLLYVVAAVVAGFSARKNSEIAQSMRANNGQNGNDLMALAVALFVVVMLVVVGVVRAYNNGKKEAVDYRSGNCTVLDVVLIDGGQVSGCYVVDSKDGMWFVKINIDANNTSSFAGPMYLPRANLKMMTLHSAEKQNVVDKEDQPAIP